MRVSSFALLALVVLALSFALGPPSSVLAQETELADLEEGATATLARSGLGLPVDIAFTPDGTLHYAAFEAGELRAVAADGSERALWTAPNLQLGGERGFVGLAVAPDFEESRAFYVYYQTNKSGLVVSRLSRVVEGAETVLLDDLKAEKLHNSGRIAFGPDGLMYLSIGDAVIDTAGRQKSAHAHDPASLNGKVLRLNADGSPAAGNPWENEVWTKGHRNVYGLAVSPDNVVLATENGPESWDEINVLEGGNDYGWPTCSGPCGRAEFVEPVLAYEDTIAPTGAVWYEGAFYFTDFNKGSVHRVRELADGHWSDERVLKFTTPRILDIAVGPEGLYLSTWDSVWRLVPAPLPAPSTPSASPSPPSPSPSPSSPLPSPSPSVETGAEIGGEPREAPGIGVLAYALVAAAALIRGRR